jgi:hypothetical protein
LLEYENGGAEKTFARFYANALTRTVLNLNPKIATVFETWRKNRKLNCKLEEKKELKLIILAEAPWISDAQCEADKKPN